MPSQRESNSATKRKASGEEAAGNASNSPASKKLKTAQASEGEGASPNQTHSPKSTSDSNKAKPQSATAAALSSISKAKHTPGTRPQPPPRHSRRTPPRRDDAPAAIPRSPSSHGQRKRPGARMAPTKSAPSARKDPERPSQNSQQAPMNNVEVVTAKYNALPELGKDFRIVQSKIKGLRKFNNWVKSAVIQKFSATEDPNPGSRTKGYKERGGLRVLDMGCGKGGDLAKWQNAPCQVDLYIGLDPADQSIHDAKTRYFDMPPKSRGRPLFNAHFFVKDCFQDWLGEVQAIRQVGIDPNPGQGMSMPGSGGGFDVVTMMFSLHYAFEDERRAKTMLRNVAGALKKGGRFVGVIPNSNVIQAKLKESWMRRKREAEGRDEPPHAAPREDGEIDEDAAEADSDAWDPERMIDPLPRIDTRNDFSGDDTPNGLATPSPMHNGHLTPYSSSSSTLPPPGDDTKVKWGNDLYSITFEHPPSAPKFAFRPKCFSWKYTYKLEEAVNEVPEFVVPWEAFRALASDFDLELRWTRTFEEVWEEERDDPELGPLSQRMQVKDGRGARMMGDEEMEAANFYLAFCFYKA